MLDRIAASLSSLAPAEQRVARLVLAEIESITEADGHAIRISASIGIASARGQMGAARGQEALLAEADQAMYATKQAHRASALR